MSSKSRAWKSPGNASARIRSTSSGSSTPRGRPVRVQEAPTHFSSNADHGDTSLCGDFAEYSMPSADFEVMRQFWEPLGFVALNESDEPYVRMSMTSDHVDLAVHRPRTLDQPMLVFAAPDMGERIERLRALGVDFAEDLPRGLDPRQSGLLRTPEGSRAVADQRGRLRPVLRPGAVRTGRWRNSRRPAGRTARPWKPNRRASRQMHW